MERERGARACWGESQSRGHIKGGGVPPTAPFHDIMMPWGMDQLTPDSQPRQSSRERGHVDPGQRGLPCKMCPQAYPEGVSPTKRRRENWSFRFLTSLGGVI